MLASSSDAILSNDPLHYSDPLTQNGKDSVAESDSSYAERRPISDNGALMTFDSTEHNDPTAGTNHLVSEADRDLMSQLNDALANYIDGSSEAV